MSENICQQPPAVLGKVPPGIVPDGLIRNVRRRPKETFPVQPRGLWYWRNFTPLPRKVVPHTAGVDQLTKTPGLEDFVLRPPVLRSAALLCSALENLTASFERFGEHGPLLPSMNGGLFEVDVFACGEGRGRECRVQVIGGGDDYRIDTG